MNFSFDNNAKSQKHKETEQLKCNFLTFKLFLAENAVKCRATAHEPLIGSRCNYDTHYINVISFIILIILLN